jgi:hypothetical protein
MSGHHDRQRGAIIVMYAMMLTTLIGFTGLAVDLGLMYLRRTQLQNAADAIALNAASRLNGLPAGVSAARSQAVFAASSVVLGLGRPLLWKDDALSFSVSPDGPWLSVGEAADTPANLRYARLDTRQLDEAPGLMQPMFMGALGAAVPAVNLAAMAVAGPRALNVLPFAVCAMGPASAARGSGPTAELVEYGFRYGVGYNLLKLNPAAGAAAGEYFYVDPIAPPGAATQPADTSDATLAPFICSGKLAYGRLAGGALNLRRPAGFTLWQQMNSRFDSYAGTPGCNADAAPPDTNIRAFTPANATWVNNPLALQTAQTSTPVAGKPLNTIADAPPPLPAVAPGLYGVLWALTPARRATGSTSFGTSFWQALYPSTPAQSPGSWVPAMPPYRNAAYTTPPSRPGRPGRRLLYVPLVSCPVPAGQYVSAPLLGIARFLMTAPASATELSAEFAGVFTTPGAGEPALAADLGLFR